MPSLVNVIPNETYQLVLEFERKEFRLFDASIARIEKGWPELAYPQKLKNLTFNEGRVVWPGDRSLDADYLYVKSRAIEGRTLQNQVLRVSYKNQAPTSQHPSHHVYGVWLYPFREKLFEVGESIGGGHADMGGSSSLSLAELRVAQHWRDHFELSGCAWVVPFVDEVSDERALLNALVKEICRHEGIPDPNQRVN
ncbi:hypothetical protein [Trinickia fusca]|uniref:DUF2442 domain-containing protein n=1 Tax=Trinickia fusca TaxID=2419777 RepID=A0A494XJ62_9BURK|nr:hypothetical protein [Trinickia fusca]RKP47593.1 hypothetical protein D7S89_15315 [Trinickia fusca]